MPRWGLPSHCRLGPGDRTALRVIVSAALVMSLSACVGGLQSSKLQYTQDETYPPTSESADSDPQQTAEAPATAPAPTPAPTPTRAPEAYSYDTPGRFQPGKKDDGGLDPAGSTGSPIVTPQGTVEPLKGPAAALMKAADEARERGDLGTAITLYRRAHSFSPNHPLPLIRLGEALIAIGAASDAIEALSEALSADGGNVDALMALGKALIAVEQYDLAVNKFAAVLRDHPNETRAYNGLGIALDKSGDFMGAESAYRQGLSVAPQDPGLLNNYGLSLAFSGRHQESIGVLRQLAFGPNASARYRQNLALAYGLAGRMDEAAEVSRIDLDEKSVQQNLATYEVMRSRAETARASGRNAGSIGVVMDRFQERN